MRLTSLILLLACKDDPRVVPAQVFPADGQTDVGLYQPLVLDGYGVNIPPGSVIPPFVEVVDLERDEVVDGTMQATDNGVKFIANLPWRPNATYLWSAHPPLPEARQPLFDFPVDAEGEPYQGSAVFSTSSGAQPLRFFRIGDQFCMVTSEPPLPIELSTLRIEDDGTQAVPASYAIVEPELYESGSLPDGDLGLGVVCGPSPSPATPATRAWLSGQSVLADDPIDLSAAIVPFRRLH